MVKSNLKYIKNTPIFSQKIRGKFNIGVKENNN